MQPEQNPEPTRFTIMSLPVPEIPLSDLHRHLDGSLRIETVEELAGRAGIPIPDPLRFWPGMGLQAALACFRFTLALLQEPENVTRVAAEMCEDAAREGVTTLEIRFAPQLHRSAPVEAVIDAALAGMDGRAGLILCGLYGEPPEVLDGLVRAAAIRPEVVGIDLAGGPGGGDGWGMVDYAPAFRRAAELGIGRTVHAGEGRPPAEIRVAIEQLLADRIGHATTILEDPSVVELACERGITIEACVTSNVQTGVVPSCEAHPIARWLETGLEVCVCVDNTLFSDLTAPAELRRISRIPGMNPERIRQVITSGHRAAFRR
jgi:adenosine deaminase